MEIVRRKLMQSQIGLGMLKANLNTRPMRNSAISYLRRIHLILAISFLSTIAYPLNITTLTGRVVGTNGEPVCGADVNIGRFGGFPLASGESGENGRFRITFAGPIQESLFLYTSVSKPRTHIDAFLIYPPYMNVFKMDQFYVGKRIDIGKSETFDVGDVPVQYWFGDVHVKLALRRRNLTASDWEKLWVRLLDKKGRLVYQESFAPSIESNADVESSEMRIMLPEGEWSFEFQKYVYSRNALYPKILGKTPKFVIARDKETPQLAVELSPF